MRYTITGDTLQLLNVEIGPGEELNSYPESMAYMTGNIRMEPRTKGRFRLRKSSGGQMKFTSKDGKGIVGLGGKIPGKVVDIDVGKSPWIIMEDSYLGSEPVVEMDSEFEKKTDSTQFGADGIKLQRASGPGMLFITTCGDFNTINLNPGQQYRISSGHAVAWERSVKYDIAPIKEVKGDQFGKEGMFITTLTGPGRIVVQSMDIGSAAAILMGRTNSK